MDVAQKLGDVVDARAPTLWQQSLLRTMLPVSAAVLCLGPILASAIAGTVRSYFWLIELAGFLLLLLSPVAARAYRMVATTYLVVVFLVILTIGLHNAWTPTVVASLCFLSVAAGMLLGRWAILVVALATFAILETGGWLVLTGRFSIPIDALTDPSSARNWIRFSIIFLLIIGMATWMLRSVVGAATRVEEEAGSAIRAAGERLESATRLRSERMTREMAIWRSQRLQMVAQLGEGFAHMFNNMLTVVRCGCEELRTSGSKAGIQQAAREMGKVARECAERTRELLVMSHATPEPIAQVRMDEVLRDGITRFTRRLRTNVECVLSLAPCGTVHMPSSWLEQMLTNLLLNAEQAMPEGGRIRLQTTTSVLEQPRWSTVDRLRPGRYAVLSVQDDGLGMSADVAGRAFEPFFTTKSPASHAGLGLTLVHGMAKQLGGSVELHRMEEGTQVSVFLPVSEVWEARASGVQKPADRSEVSEVRSPDPIGGTGPARGSASVKSTESARPSEPEAPDTGAQDSGPAWRRAAADPTRLDWRNKGLNRIVRATAIIFFAQALNAIHLGIAGIAIGCAVASALLLGSTLSPRIPYGLRLWALLLSLLGLCLTALVNTSYLAPSALVGLACCAFFAAVYGTRRTLVAILVGISLCLAGAAWWWLQGGSDGSLAQMTGDQAATWFRIGVALPLMVTIIGVAVLWVVSTARAHALALLHARAELERSHAVYQTETEALLRLEETRSRAERMEAAGLLTGMVAHDLNNSLGGILGWSEVLEIAATPEDIAEATTAIARSADYAEALVQQLQHRTGGDHRDRGLDIAAALDRMQPMLVAASRKKQHTISVHIDADPGCRVAISEHSLRRLVLNLVTNARDACGDRGGRCDIRATRESSKVVLQVSDNGGGMDELTCRRIFQAFFTTKGTHGTGLGLHSVMEIVRGTDGAVDVWSEPGSGTRMTIRWPLAPLSQALREGSPPPVSETGKARILLAEDHPIVRQVMARGLRRAGYAVIEAQDGDEALRQVESDTAFDVMCTDAVMPGEPVTHVVRRFNERYPARPVLVVSGYLPEDLGPELRANEQVRLLFKPIAQEQLIEAIEAKTQAFTTPAQP